MLALFAIAVLAGPAFAGGGCDGVQSVDTGPLITADGSTDSAPITPKPEPEG
jgi:hypothetical protein